MDPSIDTAALRSIRPLFISLKNDNTRSGFSSIGIKESHPQKRLRRINSFGHCFEITELAFRHRIIRRLYIQTALILCDLFDTMTSHLLALPNEITCIILSYSEPEDCEALARTAQLFASIWKQIKMRMLYGHPRLIKFGDATELLEAMLRNPSVALYIKELTIDKISAWEMLPEDNESYELIACGNSRLKLFESAVRASSLVTDDAVEQEMSYIKWADEPLILALIVQRLTHLEVLPFVEANNSGTEIDEGYDHLTILLKNLGTFAEPEVLSRLHTVTLGSDTYGVGGISPSARWFQYFAALPSVKTIHAWGVCDDEAKIPRITDRANIEAINTPLLKSNIKTLNMVGCNIEATTLGLYLGVFNRIKTFKKMDHAYGFTRDPDAIIRGLLKSASSTLEVLHWCRSDLDYECLRLTSGLDGFKTLKEVRIDHRFIPDGIWFDWLRYHPSIEVFILLYVKMPPYSDNENTIKRLRPRPEVEDLVRYLAYMRSQMIQHMKVCGVEVTLPLADIGLVMRVVALCRELGLDIVRPIWAGIEA